MDVYFFNQSKLGRRAKRYRKDIEELPQSLRFAHLNPKVAAYLVNKERRSSIGDETDAILDAPDSLKQGLLPSIKETVAEIKHELDKNNGPTEDASASLYKECKSQAMTVLMQITTLLRFLQGHKIRVSKTLEYHLVASYGDLIANAVYVHRRWQTKTARDAYEKERQRQERKEEEKEREREKSESEKDGDRDSDATSGTSHAKETAEKSTADKPPVKKNSKKHIKANLADILEVDAEDTSQNPSTLLTPKENIPALHVPVAKKGFRATASQQRISKASGRSSFERQHGDWLTVPGHARKRTSRAERGHSVSSRDDLSTIGDYHSESSRISNAGGHAGYYMSIISFALSSKACEDKGWIVHGDNPDEKETVLEWAQQRLRLALHQIDEQIEKAKEQGFDKPLENRYYGDSKKEALARYQRRNMPIQKEELPELIDGIYPVIPSFMVETEPTPNQILCSTSTTDGTKSIFYPSGRLAVMISPVGTGKPGVFINAYDDTDDRTHLASFTPTGRATCFHKNGVIRFLATDKGGHLANVDGAVTKKWKWPHNPNAKLPLTVVINVNDELSFRCMNRSSMQFTFCCQRETYSWCVAPTPGAVEPKDKDEIGHLLSNTTFTSQTAKEVNRSHKLRTQAKPKFSRVYTNKQKEKIKGQLLDMKNQVDANDQYENEYERELARLQTKIRVLTDEWLDYYRYAVGLKSPLLKSLQDHLDASGQRLSKSARGIPQSLPVPTRYADDDTRAISAPSSIERLGSDKSSLNSKEDAAGDSLPMEVSEIKMESSYSHIPGIIEVPPSPSTTPIIRGPTSVISSAKSRMTSAMRLQRSNGWACPVALRKDILGEGDTNCRCHRYKIPYIMDVEFDEFISKYMCENQLLVISIVSSLYPESNASHHTLEVLYSEINKNRTHPCLQSTADPFRIFLYDIASAAELSNCTKPLLLRRHNAAAGMFLMYQKGHLVFCDHIWNGYGNARKDFYKQMMKTKQDAVMGSYLPKDFRFSPTKGHRGKRSAWGGEIGGAGVDKYGSPGLSIESTIMPDTSRPTSASSTSSDSREVLRPSFQIRSLTSGGFYPPLTPLPSASPLQRAVTAPLHNKTALVRKSAPVR